MFHLFPRPVQVRFSVFLLLIHLFTATVQAQNTCIDPSQVDSTALCPTVYDPVCGCNGITYGNSCEAMNAGVTQWSPGVCSANTGCENLSVNFQYAINANPLIKSFIDQSTMLNGQIVSWLWNFGDNTSADTKNATHQYALAGEYLVCLSVKAIDEDGQSCEKTYCQNLIIPENCAGQCPYGVAIDLDGVSLKATLTPVMPDTPFFFYISWSLDDGAVSASGLEFHHLIAEPGVHTLCATYPTGDFSAETCTVCKAFEVFADCVNPAQIDSTVACPLAYIPVCGCNGVTYDNDCEAYNYGGVSSWTPGVCGSICNSLSVDFDGFNSGGSLTVWTFNDLSYFPGGQISSWFWDFGNGLISNEQNPTLNLQDTGEYEICLFVSGLFADGTQCGGSVCKTFHIPEPFCIDTAVIDLSVPCIAVYDPVCGCNGNTYDNACIAYYYYGVTEWTPGVCPDLCINPSWIDTLTPCLGIYDPVCGCDGQTYDNACYALSHGVSAWTKGVCCQQQSCQAFFNVSLLANQQVLISGLPADAESWAMDFGNGNFYFGYFDSLVYVYDSAGTYQVCLEITDLDGTCTDQYCTLVNVSLSAVAEPTDKTRLLVQPNPTSNELTLRIRDGFFEKVQVLDVFGKKVYQASLGGTEAVLYLEHLPSGMYFLNVLTDKGIISRKIAVQR